MPTMATFLQLLPRGFAGLPHRSTDGTVYSVVEGHGRARIRQGADETVLDFGPRDHFVVPSRASLRLEAPAGDCVLFSYSDRPVQAAIGLLREEFLTQDPQ